MNLRFKLMAFLFYLLIIGCSKSDPETFKTIEENIEFKHEGFLLKGILGKPQNRSSFPIVIFVHGDGPADRFQQGYYKYFWKELSKKGIGYLSWDKQGVEESEGDWLNQNMDDRAKEVISAINYIKQRDDINTSKIILWGISQGGWVVPKVSRMSDDVSSIILQSAAVNWLRQGKYHTLVKLLNQGYSEEQILHCEAYSDAGIEYLEQNAYNEYKANFEEQPDYIKNAFPLIDSQRWNFVVKNFETDIEEDLKKVKVPVLAVFGDKDENVDTSESIITFQNIFQQNNNQEYKSHLFEDATHEMIDINLIQTPEAQEQVWHKLLKGENVFAPGFMEKILKHIEN
ncbi:alpha/beta hydrolase family protein [Aquimarina sp. 2201CG5-10]|uniref:alpha/beta hydrolase family protein n=1 Tax=Aquimarina callyspongiae TaxID=3098150 RepID=UPI002AB4D923|nr:alpha/beta hydrolase [Aquimarina sp. 2201CG5-10]MDY8134871.1 alpha/beta hydrolase [Aquimarina sp. 2201CG5-10]